LRLACKVSVETLAAAAGISANTLHAAETGTRQPSPRVIKAITAALNVPTIELVPARGGLAPRDARRRLGLTQQDICQLVSKSRQIVSKVERGIATPPDPDRWAPAYQLTHDQWHAAHATAARATVARTPGRKGKGF
jgi:transcriptional regulator with XRE-family HTH domain